MKTSNKTFISIAVVAILLLGYIIYAAGKGSPEKAASQAKEISDTRELIDKPAPDFALKDRDGAVHKLSDLRGKTVVLFFNEGLMCYPACWNQMAKLSSDPRLNTDRIVSYSIVIDQPENWSYAVQKMPELASAKVLYDLQAPVSRMYAMLTARSSMHYGAYPGHSYVIIDPQGIVRYAYDDPRMAINNDLLVSEIASLSSPN